MKSLYKQKGVFFGYSASAAGGLQAIRGAIVAVDWLNEEKKNTIDFLHLQYKHTHMYAQINKHTYSRLGLGAVVRVWISK